MKKRPAGRAGTRFEYLTPEIVLLTCSIPSSLRPWPSQHECYPFRPFCRRTLLLAALLPYCMHSSHTNLGLFTRSARPLGWEQRPSIDHPNE